MRAHCEDHNLTHVYPQFTYIHYHRVYDELTIDHLSMWLDSSVDRTFTGFARS